MWRVLFGFFDTMDSPVCRGLLILALSLWLGADIHRCAVYPTNNKYIMTAKNHISHDNEGVHVYPETSDFRIIVLTYNRPHSLVKCLKHVNNVITDGSDLFVEVWVDRNKDGTVHIPTMQAVNKFKWNRNFKHRIHIHEEHAGLYGQWIKTWRPDIYSNEIVIYLEDDVDISRYALRWLKAAFDKYRGNPLVAGISLQEEYIITAAGRHKGVALRTPKDDPIYLYKIVGPWGFAPHPRHWRAFQDWYLDRVPGMSPHVPEAGLYDSWYTDMEEKHRENTMWIMWFIKFCHDHGLYTAYANLKVYTGNPHATLVANRREDGLHFIGRSIANASESLLKQWQDGFVEFPDKIIKLDYDGSFS